MPLGAHSPPRKPVDIGILTVIPPELDAAKSALAPLQREKDGPNDTVYWRGAVRSAVRECEYTFVLAGIGTAGNSSAAALATQMIERYRPNVVLLMGIAAGMRGKARIGEVVLSERVVAYEHAALVRGQGQPRPDITRVPPGPKQDALNYQPDALRLAKLFARIQGAFPPAPAGQENVWRQCVASSIECRKQVTLASGDKLLRDPDKLLEIRRNIHGKTEVIEMEAAGLVEACELADVPWLIIRGISDFGDELKDDAFHAFASCSAAAVLADFLAHGLDLGEAHAKAASPGGAGERSPFIVGLPITREQDFFGRKRETGEILEAIGKGLPVQLVGGAKVGKSSLLNWVARHVPAGRPVARISSGAALSPVKLVSEVAREVGRPEVAAALARKDGTIHAAAEQLQALGSFVLLIDEADKLATVGRDYEEGFFEVVRECVERRALTWVSASRQDLYELFGQRGLTSRFLNSSERIWVGPLEDEAAWLLATQKAPAYAERMIREAGGLAYGLQWLGDKLLRGTGPLEDVCDQFRAEMSERIFASWWKGLPPEDRAVLKQCAAGEMSTDGGVDVRRRLRGLSDRGFLVKHESRYRLAPGAAWQEFVLHAR
jgi:nucleoside phosphorylase